HITRGKPANSAPVPCVLLQACRSPLFRRGSAAAPPLRQQSAQYAPPLSRRGDAPGARAIWPPVLEAANLRAIAAACGRHAMAHTIASPLGRCERMRAPSKAIARGRTPARPSAQGVQWLARVEGWQTLQGACVCGRCGAEPIQFPAAQAWAYL